MTGSVAVAIVLALLLAFVAGYKYPGLRAASTVGGVTLIIVAGAALLRHNPADSRSQTKPRTALADRDLSSEDFRPVEVLTDGHIGSDACRKCHPRNHATWHASYHRTMTQLATDESVIGDFDDNKVRTEFDGQVYHLTRQNGRFFVEMENPGLQPVDSKPIVKRPIVMTTGSHHMQVYWYPMGRSRILSQLPLTWLKSEQRWIPRGMEFLAPTEHHVATHHSGLWNTACINCHSTHGSARVDPSNRMDTQAVEFGISCEACHGPGESHVAAHRQETVDEDYEDWIVDPAKLTPKRSAQVCGRCHSVSFPRDYVETGRINDYGLGYRPGDDLHATRFVARVNEESAQYAVQMHVMPHASDYEAWATQSFWSDGMVRISGREYNGLIESACYQRGAMSCTTCHVMHLPEDDPRPLEEWANDQLKLHGHDDQSCLQCHDANEFENSEHTHHSIESDGSRCMNCHMPYTTYGLMKAIRSHTITSPRTSESVQAGRPNACNLCHLDRTLDWSADHLARWFNQPRPELSEDQKSVSAAVVWTLSGDAGQRALMAWHMGWEPAVNASGSQ